ncbi:hypothetical protein [Microseira sp. BLCC-F43]
MDQIIPNVVSAPKRGSLGVWAAGDRFIIWIPVAFESLVGAKARGTLC